MNRIKLFSMAAIVLAAVTAAPLTADARTHIVVYRTTGLGISYLHNYGPGPLPGTYTYYDGSTSGYCAQSAAAYRGQDGRRHPCN